MSVLVNKNTRVICQGFTGKQRELSTQNRPLLMEQIWLVVSHLAKAVQRT